MTKRQKAAALNQRALELHELRQVPEAIALYQEAIAADPRWAVPLYNLGLLFKAQHQWEESLRANRLATQIDPTDEAAWWNFGIAATAVGRWNLARSAWR